MKNMKCYVFFGFVFYFTLLARSNRAVCGLSVATLGLGWSFMEVGSGTRGLTETSDWPAESLLG